MQKLTRAEKLKMEIDEANRLQGNRKQRNKLKRKAQRKARKKNRR